MPAPVPPEDRPEKQKDGPAAPSETASSPGYADKRDLAAGGLVRPNGTPEPDDMSPISQRANPIPDSP